MNKPLFVYITLAALALVVFAIWPGLDLAGARYFYHGGGFFGRNDFERFGRDFFRVTPFVVLVGVVVDVVVLVGVVVEVVVVVADWHTEILTVVPLLTCALAAGLCVSTLPGWAPPGQAVSKVVLATRPAPVIWVNCAC